MKYSLFEKVVANFNNSQQSMEKINLGLMSRVENDAFLVVMLNAISQLRIFES